MNDSTLRGEKFSLSEKHYKNLIDVIPQPLWIYEISTLKFLEVNQSAINVYGYSREEFLKMTIKDIRPKEDIPLLNDILAKSKSKPIHTAGWQHMKKDGTFIYLEIYSNDIIYDRKKARLVISNDISRLKEQDNSLWLSAAIVESSEDAIIGKTPDGIITSWNESAERMYGYKKEEVINKSISILFPPENIDEFKDIMKQIRKGKRIEHYQTTRIKKDGSRINVSISISPIKDNFKRIIGASTIARDITKIKIIEAERDMLLKNEINLREKAEKGQERLAFLSEASKILSSSLDYEITLASIAGISVPFVSDWCAIDLINQDKKLKRVAVVHSDARKKYYADQLQQVFDNVNLEATNVYKAIRTGKSVFIPEITPEYFNNKEVNIEFLSLLKTLGLSSLIIVPLKYMDKIFGAITMVMMESNRTYKEEDLTFAEEIAYRAAIAIENAALYNASLSMNTELEKRVKQRTEQLEAVNNELETFSYSVSHDLKAPLRAIEGFSRVLLEEHSNQMDEEAKRLFNIVVSNTAHMSRLIEDLLEFSRVTRINMNKVKVDMMKMAGKVFDELKSFENNRNISLSIDDLCPADGDPALLKQVWINLIANAIKFTRPRDTAIIRIGNKVEDGNRIYFIKDNGVGFDMKYSQNLFGVFQRLHKYKDFEGTGVGLALVERIIKRHGGKIWADSKLDEGASFYFTLNINEVLL
ncbi:MAG: PAS domain S-box protein [Ignavibacteriaceae bacterium]|nr:PAS domain S-box protein [Ignavibacteriaceae bacterium]